VIVTFDPRELTDAYNAMLRGLREGHPHSALPWMEYRRVKDELETAQWRMACASYQWRRRAERDEAFMREFDRGWWAIRQEWWALDYERQLYGMREPGTALVLRHECPVCRRP